MPIMIDNKEIKFIKKIKHHNKYRIMKICKEKRAQDKTAYYLENYLIIHKFIKKTN